MVEWKRVAAILIILSCFTIPVVLAVLAPSFSDTIWQTPTMKADTYYVGAGTIIANSTGLYGAELYRNGEDLATYIASLGVGATVTTASPYSYVVFKDGATYYANSTTGDTNYSNADFVTLMEAVIAAKAAGTSYFIKGGNYTVSSELDIGKGIILVGEGIDTTILTASTAFPGNYLIHILGVGATTPMQISGITFDGRRNSGGMANGKVCLWAESMNLIINGCRFRRTGHAAINVLVDHIEIDYAVIRNSVFDDIGSTTGHVGPAIKFDHRAASDQLILNAEAIDNVIDTTFEHGIKCYNETAKSIIISRNQIYNANSTGIWCDAAAVISNNIIREAGGNGITLSEPNSVSEIQPCIVDANRIYSCGGVYSLWTGGIYVNIGGSNSTLSDNYIYDSYEFGIQTAAGANYCLLIGNRVSVSGNDSINDSGTGTVKIGNMGFADS